MSDSALTNDKILSPHSKARLALARAFQIAAIFALLFKSTYQPLLIGFNRGGGYGGTRGLVEIELALNVLIFIIAGILLAIGNKLDNTWKGPNLICGTIAFVLIVQMVAIFLKWKYVLV
jgi:hypothetical protein